MLRINEFKVSWNENTKLFPRKSGALPQDTESNAPVVFPVDDSPIM